MRPHPLSDLSPASQNDSEFGISTVNVKGQLLIPSQIQETTHVSTMTRLIVVVGLIVPLIGCSKSFNKVEGTIMLDGQPVVGATVTFMPTFEGGQSGSGVTDSSGKFKIVNPTNDKGLAKGEYKVLITRAEAEGDFKAPDTNDPTGAMAEYMKGKMDIKKGKAIPMKATTPKQTLNIRYAKQDSTPFTINVPTDGALTLQLEK